MPVRTQPDAPALRAADPFSRFDERLRSLIRLGGPMPHEYGRLQRLIRHLGAAVNQGTVSESAVTTYIADMTSRHLAGTLQAEAYAQKYGYSGDFEIIDHIYTVRTTSRAHLRRWDLFFHAQAAPCAVRNRKAWFHELLGRHLAARRKRALMVLNVGSGPGRDLREWFEAHPREPVEFDCVEMDERAIAYAEGLCAPWLPRIRFHHRNVLRSVPARGYDFVWSAGLFDYLTDRSFVHLLRALLAVTNPRGEVVIGNFSDFNPSRDYMELLGNWHLHHRNRECLMALAAQAGAAPDQVQVSWEPEGVNQFLHISR